MNDKQYRLIWTVLSRSKKIKSVKGKKFMRIATHLIYTWLIPWADDDGRLLGDILWIYANILPNEDLTEKEIKEALLELHRVELIYWYKVNEERFIQIIDWEKHQRIRKDRYKSSIYPPCPSSVCQVSVTPQPVVNHTGDGDGDGDGDKGESEGDDKNKFEKFWQAYPRKKSKGQARKAFAKINSGHEPDEQLLATILATIERAKKSEDWQKENGKYIPYPATWLNAEGWKDEIMDDPQGEPLLKSGPVCVKCGKEAAFEHDQLGWLCRGCWPNPSANRKKVDEHLKNIGKAMPKSMTDGEKEQKIAALREQGELIKNQ